MNNLATFLNNYKDGVPVNVRIDTGSALILSGSVAVAGLLIILFAKLFK